MNRRHFSKKKFLALTAPQQHKKCCEVLRAAYEKTSGDQAISHYEELATWMELSDPLPSYDHKVLSDRFHWHLKQSGQSLREHRLLPTVSQQDRPEGEVPLPIAIYLDRIRSAHNIGSIIRTTEALRIGYLFFSDHMAFTDHKQVVDAAMGCHQWIDCRNQRPLSSLPKPVICLETAQEALSLYDFVFPNTFTLVVGNEEYGCSNETLHEADYLLRIPLYGRKNSLNVANAFAVTAAEIRRQYHLRMNLW